MSSLSPIAVVVVVLATAILMLAARRRDGRRNLQRHFATLIDPDGRGIACKVRFPIEETSTPCIVHATRAGWYMVSPPEVVAKQSWQSGVPLLRQPVLIPWDLLEYRRGSFPFGRWLRFDVPSKKITFFVPQNVATELLQAVGRPLLTDVPAAGRAA